MSSITSVALGASATSTSSTTSSSTSSTSETAYNTFLTLLTTQLQNQNPLDPMDSDEFTGELIQLAGVEQQVETNDQLEQLVSSINAFSLSTGVGYIGRTVEFEDDTTVLQDGAAKWNYTLDDSASSVSLSVTDASGNTVYQATGDTAAGEHSFEWDGVGSDGSTYDSGIYTLSVEALDSDGNAVGTTTSALAKVTGVDSSDGSVQLKLGSASIALDDVTAIAA
jgi:flagellar basal-body rod modification protein FlgD